MKLILTTILLTLTLATYGQDQSAIVAKYEMHAKVGNFLTRWYYNLIGTSTVYKEELILYADKSYKYTYKGNECATFDREEIGNWEKTDSLLKLSEELHYLIKDGKLYLPETLNKKLWAMKRVK